MQLFITLATIVAVAVAGPTRDFVAVGPAGPTPIVGIDGQPITIGLIPDTQPISIAPALVDFHPISVGPAIVAPGAVNIVDQADNIGVSPVAIGPALVDFEDTIVQPAPVAVAPVVAASADSAPLVQIILNINQATAVPTPVGAAAVVDQEVVVPGPVNIVEQPTLVSPIQVAEPIVPGPVNIVDSPAAPVIVEPVQVATPILPVIVEPVQVATPILPAPAVVLPDELN